MAQSVKIYEFPTLQVAAEGVKLDVFGELRHLGKIDQRTQLRLELALQEAIANSIEHGNLGLPSEWKNEICEDGVDRFSKEKEARLKQQHYADKKVKISVSWSQKELEISIQDEGTGFDLSSYQSSKGTEPYGRGLAMIRASVDEVSFDKGGTVIRMVKWL